MVSKNNNPQILYDGECALCGRSVDFIRDHGGKTRFSFLPMQSEKGKDLLERYGFSRDFSCSIVLIDDREKYSASDAMVRIFRRLDKPWSWLSWLKVIPRPVRDYFYFLVSRNRHKEWLQRWMRRH